MSPSTRFALLALALSACGDKSPATSPQYHRAATATCATDRPAANCDRTAFPGCTSDSACVDGRNGRCVSVSHGACDCTYDTCQSDADCKSGELCDCRGRLYEGHPSDANRCLPSNCRVDADCGPGGFCSPSLDGGCGRYLGVTGWFCHTAKDECVNDADCANFDGQSGGDTPFCAYQAQVGHWACTRTRCVG